MYNENVTLLQLSALRWYISASVSDCAGLYAQDQVQFLKECVKTSPGLRVTDSYGPRTEEKTSLSTSPSE